MDDPSVRLLSKASNFALVQLTERHSPGVVFQGDSLHSLVQQLRRMELLLRAGDLVELQDEIVGTREQMDAVLRHYEKSCLDLGIRLPYVSP